MKNLEENISKIEIKPLGSYFQIDENGYIINPTSYEKIQKDWEPLIEDIVDLYKDLCGENLTQVYIRGSVAKGEAVKGVSDIDTFAYVDMPEEKIKEISIDKEKQKILEKKYDFVKGVEISVVPIANILEDQVILNQSLCVYGNSVEVKKMKPGKEMAIHAPFFRDRILWFKKFLEKENSPEELKNGCLWLMKILLRVGFELTMERSQKYTRDLFPCYETFSEYYPEKDSEMREVLDFALNPTSDKNEIKRIMDNLGKWLMYEVPKHFEFLDNTKD